MISPYPPSFDGNPWSYGFALFSLTLMNALAIALLLQFVFDRRAERKAWEASEVKGQGPVKLATPLGIHRLIIAGFLMAIVIGALPDVFVLYAWGESSRQTMDVLFLIDRIGDGAAFVPFVIACGLSAWGLQVLPQKLITERNVTLRRPSWRMVRDQAKIAGMVLVVATGVTMAKASAGL